MNRLDYTSKEIKISVSPINNLESLIKDLCCICGDHTQTTLITKKHTFPIFPPEKGAGDDDAEVEKIVFASESLHKAISHLMEARKILYSIGFRFE